MMGAGQKKSGNSKIRLGGRVKHTECPKIYRKSILHILKYTTNLYLSRCNTILRKILGHSVAIHFKDAYTN